LRRTDTKRKLLAVVLFLIMVGSVLSALPVSATSVNPTTIKFGTYNIPWFQAFYNLTSSNSGDILFVCEGYVYYATPANEPAPANQAFSFEVLSPTGQVMLSAPLNSYGDRPISIYLSAAQVTALNTQYGINLINNQNISFVIAGNPLYFPTLTAGVNEVTQPVSSSYWLNEWLVYNISYSSTDIMQQFMLQIALDMQNTDSPVTPYLIQSAGVTYLNASAGTSGQQSGQSLMLQGIGGLQNWCQAIFQTSSSPMTAGQPATTQSIQTGNSVQNMMGSTIANGLDGFRAYLGLAAGAGGRTEAGVIITVIACGFLVYYMTKKGFVDQRIIFIACAIVVVAFGWLGIFPISVLFLLAAGIAIYTFYYFWTRGIL